ncbi:MAG: MBL fold metallo-hydrolase [Candidatus Aminicenantes bacterium]|nr:MAG: MBL fold metallo-hydrolase [Candidatus Aminicenantes bacterium]
MKKIFTFVVGIILFFSGVNVVLTAEKSPIKLTILFDNYLYLEEGLKSKWGFSSLIEGMEKTILFDTGSSGDLLLSNIKQLKVNPGAVEIVVISHKHWDHVGGLPAFLEINPNVSVYMPTSVAQQWEPEIKKRKAKPVAVNQPLEVCKHVFLTGEMEGPINEQAIILDTTNGLIVITGCAHPGIVNVIEKAKKIGNKDVYMVLGGFHLARTSGTKVKGIIERFRKLGVLKVGPTHCTGDKAIQLFKEAYGKNYVKIGVGRVININN